ncbi:MAG TPA: hypothetical protein VGO31_11285 [Microbacteriaceae bacterium]|nr:hypothetical protein [Microbacteriaceae bacterium]
MSIFGERGDDGNRKVSGWKVPTNTEVHGAADTPDACPICETVVQSDGFALGTPSSGDTTGEPFRHTQECPTCHAVLRRAQGTSDPWIATAQ